MINTKQFLTEKYIDVYYDENSKFGYAIWKDFAKDTEYIKAVDMQLKMIIDSEIEYFICDIRKFKGATLPAQKYTTDEIMPKMYNSSKLKKIAYIVGNDVFANFTLSVIRKNIQKEAYVLTNAFTTIETAIEWLNE